MTGVWQIGPGSRVRLHLSLTLADGTVAESTFDQEPLALVIGDGTLIEGLELALYGMRAGERQRLTLHPDQAFGKRDPGKVHWLPRAEFPPDMTLEPGVIIGFESAAGEEIPGAVLAVEGDRVQVDFNHPLAGHPVIFECEILDVQPPE